MNKILDLGVFGFKIYPLKSLNGVDWTDPENIQQLLHLSSKFQTRIFIHPDWPLSSEEKEKIETQAAQEGFEVLQLHNRLYPPEMETKYVKFIINNYKRLIQSKNLPPEKYPIIHFCHISTEESYKAIKQVIKAHPQYKLTFEVTPHHLLLSNSLTLSNPLFGKVLPPLREKRHSTFLFRELGKGNIDLLGTDHAPHSIEEKSQQYPKAPSGFPGFETYPLLLLNEVCKFNLSLDSFIHSSSTNPALTFNLREKGRIEEGYLADLLIIDRIFEYQIDPRHFQTKAQYSPFEHFPTAIQIWKVFLRGREFTPDINEKKGKVLKMNRRIEEYRN